MSKMAKMKLRIEKNIEKKKIINKNIDLNIIKTN